MGAAGYERFVFNFTQNSFAARLRQALGIDKVEVSRCVE